MNITHVLTNKDLSDEEKVKTVASIVTDIRNEYGNEDITINAPEINTADGSTNLIYLANDSKVAVAFEETKRIKREAIEYARMYKGININKKIMELIATSPILVNISISETGYAGDLTYL
jgi:hypothetical protein